MASKKLFVIPDTFARNELDTRIQTRLINVSSPIAGSNSVYANRFAQVPCLHTNPTERFKNEPRKGYNVIAVSNDQALLFNEEHLIGALIPIAQLGWLASKGSISEQELLFVKPVGCSTLQIVSLTDIKEHYALCSLDLRENKDTSPEDEDSKNTNPILTVVSPFTLPEGAIFTAQDSLEPKYVLRHTTNGFIAFDGKEPFTVSRQSDRFLQVGWTGEVLPDTILRELQRAASIKNLSTSAVYSTERLNQIPLEPFSGGFEDAFLNVLEYLSDSKKGPNITVFLKGNIPFTHLYREALGTTTNLISRSFPEKFMSATCGTSFTWLALSFKVKKTVKGLQFKPFSLGVVHDNPDRLRPSRNEASDAATLSLVELLNNLEFIAKADSNMQWQVCFTNSD